MPAGNLKTGITRLSESLDDLMQAWSNVSEYWRDENSLNFRQNHLEPMVPKFKAALDASNYMHGVVQQAVKRCEEQHH